MIINDKIKQLVDEQTVDDVMIINDKIKQLIEEQTVDEEFFSYVEQIAKNMAVVLPAFVRDEPESMAVDFLVALSREEVGQQITTPSDLKREFRRWITRHLSPQESELWLIISEALLFMEKKGRVARPARNRAYHNDNSTTWFLSENEGKAANWSALDSISTKWPSIASKGEKDRILKPKEAQSCLLVILEAVGGEISMQHLVKELSKHLPLLDLSASLDAEKGHEDGSVQDLHDMIPSRDVLQADTMLMQEESEHITTEIWRQACVLEMGADSISGARILCCYYIPKYCAGEKVLLADFGPTSTVADVVKALGCIMKEWLPMVDPEQNDAALEQWQCIEITRRVLAAIACLCSEKNYCRTFYNTWS